MSPDPGRTDKPYQFACAKPVNDRVAWACTHAVPHSPAFTPVLSWSEPWRRSEAIHRRKRRAISKTRARVHAHATQPTRRAWGDRYSSGGNIPCSRILARSLASFSGSTGADFFFGGTFGNPRNSAGVPGGGPSSGG